MTQERLITQIDYARAGKITPQMEAVASKEHKTPEEIRVGVAKGCIAIPANIHHAALSPEGVGEGMRTKVNVNLGISGDLMNAEMELEKVRTAIELGAEGIMDLSNHGKTHDFRKQLIDLSDETFLRHHGSLRWHYPYRFYGSGPCPLSAEQPRIAGG